MPIAAKELESIVRSMRFLVVDDEPYARKVVRALLTAMGIRHIQEASDGASGIDAILTFSPDIVLVDWEMPGLDGPGFLRRVRSPGVFPMCDVPVIMLTGHGEKSRVTEAIRLGIHEYLLKPVSMQALQTRIASIVTNPRPMIRRGSYYGPAPRKAATYKPDHQPLIDDIVLLN